jgi:branched-chain amino acid transport system permease protein
MVCLYAILAQSLNLVVGYCGLLSLCHAAFFGLGAYTSALLMVQAHWSFLPSLCAAVVVVGLVAWLVSHPVTRLRGDFFVLAAIGFQMIVHAVLSNWVDVTNGPYGVTGIPRPSFFGYTVSSPPAFLCLAVVAGLAAWAVLGTLISSPFGRALQSVRENEVAAASLGKDTRALKRSAFTCAAMVAAVPGAVFATYATYIDPSNFGLEESIFILCIVVIGGAGSVAGPIVGAAILVMFPEFLRFVHVPDVLAANFRQILYGLALVLVMRLRPQGIAGRYAFD